MTLKWLTRVGIAATAGSCALAGCSDDPAPATGQAGSATGGSIAGNPSGGSTAGSAVGGSATTAGTAGVPGVAGHGGVAGSAGTAGSGGASGGAGKAGAGGTAGTDAGGAGGEGGASNDETLLFDFETDVQGWEGSDALALTVDAAQFTVKNVKLWPGTKVVFHLWTPAGTDTLWAQAYSQSNNWKKWDTDGGSPVTLVRGGWTTIPYTVPSTFPGGLQLLGLQIGSGETAFAGGDFYIDSVVVSGGVEECAGTGTGTFDFEAADVTAWKIDGNPASPADPDTAIVQSTAQANGGTGSLKVSFAALPAGTAEAAPARRIFIDTPTAYCTDEVTFNVWTAADSAGLDFQGFSQFDNYSGWDSLPPPATITRGGWTQLKYTLPAGVGPGGVQRVGVQFLNNGAAYTGDAYIDDVSW
jgi:hypothetical protein